MKMYHVFPIKLVSDTPFMFFTRQDWAEEDYSWGGPVNVMAPGLLTYYHPSLRNPFGR